MKKYFIATDQGIQEVFAQPIQVGKWRCFYQVNDLGEFDEVIVSEYYSGMQVCKLITPDFISPHRMAEQLLNEHDEQTITKHCRGILSHAGLSYPLNTD